MVTAATESDSESETSPKDRSLTEVLAAVELIATTFEEPLAAVDVGLLVLQDEVKEVVE